MQFKTDAANLSESLRIVRKLAAPTSGNVSLSAQGKKFVITAINEVNRCQIVVPGNVSGEGEIGVNLDSIDQAIRGRGDFVITVKNSSLYIKGDRYRVELPGTEVESFDTIEMKQSRTVKIDQDQATWLTQAVAACALKTNTVVSTFMPVGVRLGKSAFVACFDSSHLSFISSKEITGDSEFIVPLDLMQNVLDAFNKQPFTVKISDTAIEVSNKLCRVWLNLPELDDQGPSLDAVFQKSREVKKTNGTEMLLSKAEILAFLDNSKAVAIKERGAVKINGDGKNLTLQITTASGTVKTAIACKSKVSFEIDYEFFDEIVRKSAEELHLKVVDDAFLACSSSKAFTVATLNRG